ncbi:MAG: aquaporin family protein [Synergistaceae bacterium]|nr:aquaporin family protein [Synergistaceae bacterium]MBP9957017.1 aquaporin family protein [Synergistaceae bacterium]
MNAQNLQLLGEFVGTMVLVTMGDGTVANAVLNKSKGQGGGWIHIIWGWAIAVMMGVFAAITIGAPQADLNPAVTLFKTMNGIYTTGQAIPTMLVQMLGGFCGAIVVYLVYLPHWDETTDQGGILAVFCTGPAIRNYPKNVLTEVIATIFLICGIMFIFSSNVGALVPGYGPFMVGLLILGLGATFGGPTGYAMNPARDLGPRIAHAILPIKTKGSSDWDYCWVPVFAPMVGAVLAFMICKALGVIG